jgi:hypothetical protein
VSRKSTGTPGVDLGRHVDEDGVAHRRRDHQVRVELAERPAEDLLGGAPSSSEPARSALSRSAASAPEAGAAASVSWLASAVIGPHGRIERVAAGNRANRPAARFPSGDAGGPAGDSGILVACPMVDLIDETFVVAAPADVAAALHDEALWRSCGRGWSSSSSRTGASRAAVHGDRRVGRDERAVGGAVRRRRDRALLLPL